MMVSNLLSFILVMIVLYVLYKLLRMKEDIFYLSIEFHCYNKWVAIVHAVNVS